MTNTTDLSRYRPLSTASDLPGNQRHGARQALAVTLIGLAVLVLVNVLQPKPRVLLAEAPLEAVLFASDMSDR